MATYSDLLDIASSTDGNGFRRQVQVAVLVATDVIRLEDPGTANHANRLVWARGVLADPEGAAQRMIWAVLAQNRTYTVAQITEANDVTVQTAVMAAVNLVAGS